MESYLELLVAIIMLAVLLCLFITLCFKLKWFTTEITSHTARETDTATSIEVSTSSYVHCIVVSWWYIKICDQPLG